MSVYPDGSKPTPKGALTPTGVKALQSVTEESARNQIRSQALVPWAEGRQNFFQNIIGGIGKALEEGLTGIITGISDFFNPIRKAGAVARDKQVDFNDRVDLLSPLLDYGSLSTPPSKGDALKGTGRMPFNYQIGPMRGVTPVNNMLRLDDKGLWDLRAMLTASWIVAGGELRVSLRVLEPDGKTIFSEQAHYADTLRSQTMTLVSSVVIPEPGYFVDMWVVSTIARGWWGGPRWTRLSAQHMSRNVNGGDGSEDSTDPTEAPPEVSTYGSGPESSEGGEV